MAEGLPLLVAVLHPRLGFTTDPVIVARQVERRTGERAAATGVLERLLGGRSVCEVHLMPYARRPWRNPTAQARRAVQLYPQREPAQLILAAPHLQAPRPRP